MLSASYASRHSPADNLQIRAISIKTPSAIHAILKIYAEITGMSENPYPPSAQKGMSHMTNQTVVEKIADYIENHLEEDIPLDKIAKELNYSKFYIARVFADNTGYTIYKYIQGRRLTLAARKLAETDKPIVEIAYEARYGSQQAFTLAFSQFYLCTPQTYRMAYLSPGSPESGLAVRLPPPPCVPCIASHGAAAYVEVKWRHEYNTICYRTDQPRGAEL